jgi:hypothetical protein
MNVAVGGSRQEKLAAAHHGFTIQYRSTCGVLAVSDWAVYQHRYN